MSDKAGDKVKDILFDRGITNGPFQIQWATAQRLKARLRLTPGWQDLSLQEREALDMIMLKISRIVAGDSTFVDHWHDIIGYATLVVDSIKNPRIGTGENVDAE